MSGYNILKTLGAGAFGKCYLVTFGHGRSQQKAAMKDIEIHHIQSIRDVTKEIGIMKVLDHPHIVRYINCFSEGLHVYIVMEFCEGGDLRRKITKARTLFNEEIIVAWMLQLTEALDYCHTGSPKILHRDIKPDNVFLDADENIKLGDFGVGKAILESRTGSCVGTPMYTAPEVYLQLLGSSPPYNSKCDMWSVGVLMYELTTLRIPEKLPNIWRSGKTKRIPKSYVDELDHVVTLLMSVNPSTRPSAQKTIRMLQEIREDSDSEESTSSDSDY